MIVKFVGTTISLEALEFGVQKQVRTIAELERLGEPTALAERSAFLSECRKLRCTIWSAKVMQPLPPQGGVTKRQAKRDRSGSARLARRSLFGQTPRKSLASQPR